MDYPSGSRAVPVTQEAINALEKTKLDNGSHEDGSAGEPGTTCLEDMNLREVEVVCMPCKHKFHHHCLARWLKTSNLCPLCHFTMPSSLSDVETLHQSASSFAYPKKQSCLSLSKSRFTLRLGVPNIIIYAHCPRDDADAGPDDFDRMERRRYFFYRFTRARSFMLERDNTRRVANSLALMRQRLFG
ncbi:hypothetical protein NL676_027784 [Syzygium grande]|nr:hypothetical protein NL676_027784 [Syzygium grande]